MIIPHAFMEMAIDFSLQLSDSNDGSFLWQQTCQCHPRQSVCLQTIHMIIFISRKSERE